MGLHVWESAIREAEKWLGSAPHSVCLYVPGTGTIWSNDSFAAKIGWPIGEMPPVTVPIENGRTFPYGAFGADGKRTSYRVNCAAVSGESVLPAVYALHFREDCQGDERYRIVAEHTMDAIVLVDRHAVVQFVSPAIYEIIGYTAAEYEGMDAFDVIHPDDRDTVRNFFLQVLTTGLPVDTEYRVQHADGRMLNAETRVKPVLDADGEVQAVVAVVRDVTERIRSEELLETILDSVNAVVWSTDKDFSRMMYCSDSIERLAGIPKPAYMASPVLLHEHVHPDDNARLTHEVKAMLDRGIPVTEEIRFYLHGTEKWYRMTAFPQFDHNGSPDRIHGLMLDVTDRKSYELMLEESEQRYKSLFDNNLDGVFSIELNGLFFESANRAFESITGIRLEDLSDRCFMGLIQDEDHAAVYEALFSVVNSREPRDIECRILCGARGERIVNITFVPIAVTGELHGVHGIVKDITLRKREERELMQSEERYKALQRSLHRLANDLSHVMKVSDLESRLIAEVKDVLQAEDASIEELPAGVLSAEPGPEEKLLRIGEKLQATYLRIRLGRPLLPIEREWLDTAVHYVTILYDNLHLIEDLMKRLEEMVSNNETPRWMLRLLFRLSEKERAALSSDLHDSVLQDLIIWYRRLESLRTTADVHDTVREELRQIEEGLLDAIHQIRITCNELRPPFLLRMGLAESLKSLFAYARMFANYEIEFSADRIDEPLGEEQILGLYRIVQELLNNANKHSQASKVAMTLAGQRDKLTFVYEDDGVGMEMTRLDGSFQHMGITGIKQRVQSLEGEVTFRSAPNAGFRVTIELPNNR